MKPRKFNLGPTDVVATILFNGLLIGFLINDLETPYDWSHQPYMAFTAVFAIVIFVYSLFKRNHLEGLKRNIQPRERMDTLITECAAKGFMVQTRTEYQIQFLRKKQFSLLWSLAWFCVFGVGLIVYILYYMSKRDDLLTVNFAQFPDPSPLNLQEGR